MRVYPKTTGVTKTSDLPITKPVGSLVIYTDKLPNAIVNELITVYVERANGDNTELLTRVPLIDFMMISTFGNPAIQFRGTKNDGDFKSVALCELTPNGAIYLNDNERIKVVLEGLNPANNYMIDGVEEPVTTNEIYKFDRKSALAGESARKFNVLKYDTICFTNPQAIEEIVLEYDNGRTTRHSYDELVSIANDTDPQFYTSEFGLTIQQMGVASYYNGTNLLTLSSPDKLVFPLVGVREMEIIKTESELVQFTCCGDELASVN